MTIREICIENILDDKVVFRGETTITITKRRKNT